MSIYTLGQTFNDLTWFHVNAMTFVAGMTVTVRGAGKFSVKVVNPEILEQSIAHPADTLRSSRLLRGG